MSSQPPLQQGTVSKAIITEMSLNDDYPTDCRSQGGCAKGSIWVLRGLGLAMENNLWEHVSKPQKTA